MRTSSRIRVQTDRGMCVRFDDTLNRVTDDVRGWVWEDNVSRMLRHLSAMVDYKFDDLDADAVEAGIVNTDADLDRWFDYPLVGSRQLQISLARHPDAAPVAVRISDDLEEVLAARAETLLAVLSDPR
jgi:hypothetical protein